MEPFSLSILLPEITDSTSNDQISATCITSQDDYILLGTNDGQLLLYKKKDEMVEYVMRRGMGVGKKDVKRIEIVGGYKFPELKPVGGNSTLKGVEWFESVVSVIADVKRVEVVVSRRRMFQFYKFYNGRFELVQEIELMETPEVFCVNENMGCYGCNGRYKIIQFKNNEIIELIGYENRPFIRMINEGFLVVTGMLGIFVDGSGNAIRNTLHFMNAIVAIEVKEFHVVALTEENILIYNSVQGDLCQTIPIPMNNVKCMGRIKDELIGFCCNKTIFSIIPLPIDKKIIRLIENLEIEEAMKLFESEEYLKNRKDELIYEKFGSFYLNQGMFDVAKEMFEKIKDLSLIVELSIDEKKIEKLLNEIIENQFQGKREMFEILKVNLFEMIKDLFQSKENYLDLIKFFLNTNKIDDLKIIDLLIKNKSLVALSSFYEKNLMEKELFDLWRSNESLVSLDYFIQSLS
ncbi:hypothetical protein ROZALSC1DRAFT_30238, partial [Rozella allomycis CSF55]